MSLHPAVLGYVPPPNYGCAKVFFDNLQQFPTKHEMILFSEHDWPGVIKLKGSPEQLKNTKFPNGQPNPFALNNALFLTGLRIARERPVSHVLYLEADCRVGRPQWDDVVFDEFFSIGRPLIAGGSLVTYNPCNHSQEAARRWQQLVGRNLRRNFPIPTYGWLGAASKAPSCVFPNGALGIYDMAWMARYFNLDDTVGIAQQGSAWDLVIGQLIWKEFEEDSYEVLGHLESIFSSYGDILTSPVERQKMLTSGEVVATHQHKDDWQP